MASPAHPKRVGLAIESDPALPVGQVFTVVLEPVGITWVVDEESGRSTAPGQKPSGAEADDEAEGVQRVAGEVGQALPFR